MYPPRESNTPDFRDLVRRACEKIFYPVAQHPGVQSGENSISWSVCKNAIATSRSPVINVISRIIIYLKLSDVPLKFEEFLIVRVSFTNDDEAPVSGEMSGKDRLRIRYES
jgi:hypothetical protein